MIMSELVQKAASYATLCHHSTNHLYDGKPYAEAHLSIVVAYALLAIDIIPEKDRDTVISAAWCHDVIEDCRQTYNDVKDNTSEEVADIVYALTNEKGKTRKQRADHRYYRGILDTEYAVYVKLCNRLANVTYSKSINSSWLEVYREEHNLFKSLLCQDVLYTPMFEHLERLLA